MKSLPKGLIFYQFIDKFDRRISVVYMPCKYIYQITINDHKIWGNDYSYNEIVSYITIKSPLFIPQPKWWQFWLTPPNPIVYETLERYEYKKVCRGCTDLVLVTVINNFTIKILNMKLNVKEFVDVQLALVDHETGLPVAAIFDDITLASSDENIFTVSTDGDGNKDVVGVTAGTASITVTANATYVNKDDETVTFNKSVSVDVTVAKPAATDSTDMVVTFTDAKPTPTQAPVQG